MTATNGRRLPQALPAAAVMPEALECRRLLSGYFIAVLATLDTTTGINPVGGVTMDSAGNLFGTTTAGGPNNGGTVFSLAKGGGAVKTIASFDDYDSATTPLLVDSAGDIFGTTSQGGANGFGFVYEIVKGATAITTLASFDATQQTPSGLIEDSAGDLFGTTNGSNVTTNSGGSVFEVVQGSGVITTLASSAGLDSSPVFELAGALTMDSAGNLYGTADQGGDYGQGAVFEVAKGSGAFTVLASFNPSTDGVGPGSLIMDAAGNLYGTTTSGGDASDGTVFEVAVGSGVITTLASFDGTDGNQPNSPLLIDSAGDLFGTTFSGGDANDDGVAFEIVQGSGVITTLVTFNGSNGSEPSGALTMDSAGDIFGATDGALQGLGSQDGTIFELLPVGSLPAVQLAFTTPPPSTASAGATLGPIAVSVEDVSGNVVTADSSQITVAIALGPLGASLGGTVSATAVNGVATFTDLSLDQAGTYTLTATDATLSPATSASFTIVAQAAPSGYTLSTLANFDASTASPSDGVVMDADGDLYGTALGDADGAIYELAKGSGAVAVLANFDSTDQLAPDGGRLLVDSAGDLYGTTNAVSAANNGTVFELLHDAGAVTTLAAFTGATAGTPKGGVIEDSAGNLYGTTVGSGTYFVGSAFEVAADSGVVTTLASAMPADAADPQSELIMDAAGNLYGIDDQGGDNHVGSVFELVKGSNVFTVLASFNTTVGDIPAAGLVMDSAGNIYGTTTANGPNGSGTVFELAANSGVVTPLASFDQTVNGSSPQSTLVVDSSGDLFGTTEFGGANGDGIVFEVVKGSGMISVLAAFNGTDGIGPSGGLAMDAAGNIYGATENGGANNDGVIFELSPSTAAAGRQLAFTAAPTTAVAGVAVAPPLTVSIEDSQGNVIAGDDSAVTLAIASGPPDAALSGTVTATAVNGVATFGGLSFSAPGAYTLSAGDGASAPVTSAAINVSSANPPSPVAVTLGHVVLPAAVVAGSKLKAKVPVVLTNQGVDYKGGITVNIYADAGTNLDGNQALVTMLAKNFSIKSGKTKTVNFNITSLPSTLPNGIYYLLAQVVDDNGLSNVTPTLQTVHVAAAFIQPAVMVGAVTPATIPPKKSGMVVLIVTNNGNVAASGIDITLAPSADGVTPLAGAVLGTTHSGARIQPGQSKTFRLHFKITGGIPTGSYFPYVSISLGGISTTAAGTASFTLA